MTPRGFMFELSGGDPALDFANTVVTRRGEHAEDLLGSYSALVKWSEQSGLIDSKAGRALIREAARSPIRAGRALRAAIEIRETIFRAFSGELDDATLRRLSDLSDEALLHRRLVRHGDGVGWEWDPHGLDQMLWPVVFAATGLLTSEVHDRVRECQGTTCRWLFIDNSRQRNRRWCDMTTCGNRAKARRHYAKRTAREENG